MAAKPRDPALLLEALEAVKRHGGVKQAARAIGVPHTTLQHRYDAAKKWQDAGGQQQTETVSVNGDQCEITKTTHERVRTLADLVRVCQIDTNEWDVERWVANKWDSAAKLGKDETERIAVTELYQIKVWLKRNRPMALARLEIQALREDAAAKMPKRVSVVRRAKSSTGILFEPHIPDLHAGKLAWAEETGWENYDLKTAERVFDAAIDALILRAKSFDCDRVLLPWGNDLLHYDNEKGTTTSGTQLNSADSRIQKVFTTVRRMTTRTIDRLREEVGPVTVLMVSGNHDKLMVWCLGDSLQCWYRGDKGVTIDNAPTARKYYRHGDVMLMFTHGNLGKLEKYPETMAAEEPEMWGATRYREAHTGDKHHQRVLELKGCKVRISPALCPPDAWHSENHYIGTHRSAEAFIWDEKEGLIGTAFYTVQREGAA